MKTPKSISKKIDKIHWHTMVSFHLEICGMNELKIKICHNFFHETGSKWSHVGVVGGRSRGEGREVVGCGANTPIVLNHCQKTTFFEKELIFCGFLESKKPGVSFPATKASQKESAASPQIIY